MFGFWLFNSHLYHASLILTSWLREITNFVLVLFTFLESSWYLFFHVPSLTPDNIQSNWSIKLSLFCHLPNYNIFFWLLLVISSSQAHATKQLSPLTTMYIFQKNNSWVVWATSSSIFARGLYMCDVDAINTRQKDFELLHCLALILFSMKWLSWSLTWDISLIVHRSEVPSGLPHCKNQRFSDDIVLMAIAAISTREISNPASSIKYINEFNRAEWWIQTWGQWLFRHSNYRPMKRQKLLMLSGS